MRRLIDRIHNIGQYPASAEETFQKADGKGYLAMHHDREAFNQKALAAEFKDRMRDRISQLKDLRRPVSADANGSG